MSSTSGFSLQGGKRSCSSGPLAAALVEAERARIAARAAQEQIVAPVAVHVAGREARAELRKSHGQQRLPRKIVERPFAMGERLSASRRANSGESPSAEPRRESGRVGEGEIRFEHPH